MDGEGGLSIRKRRLSVLVDWEGRKHMMEEVVGFIGCGCSSVVVEQSGALGWRLFLIGYRSWGFTAFVAAWDWLLLVYNLVK